MPSSSKKCEFRNAAASAFGVSGIFPSSSQRRSVGGNLPYRECSAMMRFASATVVGSGSVGPDASADSIPAGTSLTASVTFVALCAATASRPPFPAEMCFRTVLIASIEAPQLTSARCIFCTSSSVCAGSSGSSTSADPPPESKKNTSVFSSHFFSSASIASAAFQLSAFGTGCPATKYFIPARGFRAAVGADTTPSSRTKGASTCASPSTIPCAAFPIATTRSFSKSRRSILASPHISSVPLRRSFRCIVAGISIAASVSWKICRGSCFKCGMKGLPGNSLRCLQNFWIQNVRRPFSREQRNDIFRRDACHFRPRFQRSRRNVRREHHIRAFQPRMNQRLVLVNIQSRASNYPALQRRHQRRLIHDRSTRCVDQERRRLHPAEFRRVEQSPRLRQQRHVHADKIGLTKKRVHFPKLRLQFFLHVFRRAHRVGINHLHLKTARAPRHRSPDPPESHKPQRLPPHVRTHELIQVPVFPISRTRQRFALAQPPSYRHQQRPRKIRRRFVQHSRRICRRHAALRARRHVDIVESHRYVCRNTQLRRLAQQLLVDFFRQQTNQPLFVLHAPQNFFPRRTSRFCPVFHLAAFLQDFPGCLEQAVSRKHLRFRHRTLFAILGKLH